MKTDQLSIIVPCYNEEASLPLFIDKIKQVQTEMSQVKIHVLFVNDGSTDNTLDVIKQLQKHYSDWIYFISFSRNFGKEAAIAAGLEYARGDYVAVMDADLQDPPHLLPEMYRLLTQEEYDVVGTKRISRQGEPWLRSIFSNWFYKLSNSISFVRLEEGARDYRMMSRQVVDAILSLPERTRFSKGIFSWVGFNTYYLSYENIERQAGKTKWNFFSLFSYAIEGIVSFSDFPLTIASYVGFITFLIALIYGGYIVVRTLLFGVITPGWPSLAVIVVGMGGLQLLCLGILGKYIAKIFIESKQRPLFLIKESQLPNK